MALTIRWEIISLSLTYLVIAFSTPGVVVSKKAHFSLFLGLAELNRPRGHTRDDAILFGNVVLPAHSLGVEIDRLSTIVV